MGGSTKCYSTEDGECVRGEVATVGGKQVGDVSESQGLIIDPDANFLGAAGGRKKGTAVLRTK